MPYYNIWVRRTPFEYGNYVDAEGTRYIVQWCSSILSPNGFGPAELGYEQHASVEAACEAWGLVPYEEPELEPSEI